MSTNIDRIKNALPRETVQVLWHPAGTPRPVSAIRVAGKGYAKFRYYAQAPSGTCWLLSNVSRAGWRSPVLRIKSGLAGIMLRVEGAEDLGGVERVSKGGVR